ncbi:hypothetical protein B0H14DRAFT_3440656 [Mycena olivaceomarginata]|nr:hypothetical protein B0H14DRAFT_3440656 [Mycena olivaceomarginata]
MNAVMGLTPEEGAQLDADEMQQHLEEELANNKEEFHPANDDEFKSNSEEEDDFKIKYEVPYKNATQELVLPATTSFSKFLAALASKMELLETAEDYESMMDDIEEYRNNCLKSKSRVVKPFAIVLSDTSAAPERGGAKTSSKKKDAQPAAPLEASEQQEHKLMAEIEKHHACQEHIGKAWNVTSSGEHYQYTNNDLVIWPTLMRRNLASVDKVPDQLKIEDQIDRQRRARRGLQASQSANNSAFNGGGMWLQMAPPPWMYMAPPPWMMQPPANQATPVPAKPVTPSPPRKRKLYPAIGDWLRDLDVDEDRGQDSLNYGQYAGVLKDIGIIRLDDLLEVGSTEKLQELAGPGSSSDTGDLDHDFDADADSSGDPPRSSSPSDGRTTNPRKKTLLKHLACRSHLLQGEVVTNIQPGETVWHIPTTLEGAIDENHSLLLIDPNISLYVTKGKAGPVERLTVSLDVSIIQGKADVVVDHVQKKLIHRDSVGDPAADPMNDPTRLDPLPASSLENKRRQRLGVLTREQV